MPAKETKEEAGGEIRPIQTTLSTETITLHLFQVVYTYPRGENNTPDRWVIIKLEDTIHLASPDFEFKTTINTRTDDVDDLDPQTTESGFPIFGY